MILLVVAVVACSCRGGQLTGASAQLRATPQALDFPDTFVGYGHDLSVRLANGGSANRHASFEVAAPWVLDSTELDIAGGSSVEVVLHFRPSEAGAQVGALSIASDTGQALSVPLLGEAKATPQCPPPSDCQTARFDPQTGTCGEAPGPDGVACGAGNLCITQGSCSAGKCLVTLKDCDDQNACTRDSCNPVSGCLHEDISSGCPTPGNNCSVAVCHPTTGCGEAPAIDGTHCGPSDCTTAQVCVTGACVARAVPEGDTCANASVCQGAGVCENKVCVRGPAETLQPAWSYVPAADRRLQYDGVVDLDGNVYFYEWSLDGKYSDLISLDATGAERFRAPLTSCGAYGCGHHLALDLEGGRIFLTGYASKRVSARGMGNGRVLWERDPTVGLPVYNRGSNGQAVFGVGASLLLGTSDLMGVEVSEGSTDHWAYVVPFDRATGQPASWRISKKGHTYGIGSSGAGEVSLSSANCWAPAGEVASFSASGSQTHAEFAAGGAEAFGPDYVFVAGYTRSLLLPRNGSPVTIPAPAGGSFSYGEGLLSGTRLLVTTTAGPARYELNDFDTRTGQPRWKASLAPPGTFTALPDLALLADGSVFASAATMTNTGIVATFDARGIEQLNCPLPSAPQSPAAVRKGSYTVQLNGALVAFSLPGLDTASSGWVTQRGSPARDKRAR